MSVYEIEDITKHTYTKKTYTITYAHKLEGKHFMYAYNAHIEFHFWLGEYIYAKIEEIPSLHLLFFWTYMLN